MNCPFCASQWRDLVSVARHIELRHADRQQDVVVHLQSQQPTEVLCIRLPVLELDIDAIYTKRPDLVGTHRRGPSL